MGNPIKKVVSKIKKAINPYSFDMSSKEAREAQVKSDFYLSKSNKSGQVQKWQRLDEYYNNKHYTKQQIEELIEQNNWNFTPPVLPDPFIQVEINIDPLIPEVEFIGRDGDDDNLKAKERQQVVEYIVYNNKVKQMNTDNERNLNKLGNAFWKVAFDDSVKGFGFIGDIVIGNPSPANIFNDPAAYDVQDCEYIIYAFRMHRRKARRMFGDMVDSLGSDGLYADTEIFDRDRNRTILDDTVQVIEYWYRDDEGDIACSIQVDFNEVKFIPKYWKNTRASGNQLYPFIKYCKIPVDMGFWDKGEIETTIDLVDAADREFISMLLTDMMQPADIIVYEEGSLAPGETIKTGPNAQIKMAQNKANSIRRLGGLAPNVNALNVIEMIHKKIEETTGTSTASTGVAPFSGVTTASGIAQLNERSDQRKIIKKADRVSGFERLYELIDWTALEFYNTDRVIQIRGKEASSEGSFNNPILLQNNNPLTIEQQQNMQPDMIQPGQQVPGQPEQPPKMVKQPQPKNFIFNSDSHRIFDKKKAFMLTKKGVDQGKTDEEIKQIVEENAYYYPKVDCEIVAGDGINKSLAFTLQVLQDLIKTPITVTNKEMVAAMIDLLNIPQKKDIKDAVMNFQPAVMPKETIAFKDLPLDGQVQMAQHAGIQLNPKDMINGVVQGIAVQGSQPLAVDNNANDSKMQQTINQPQSNDNNQKLTPEELQLLMKATPEQQAHIMQTLGLDPQEVMQQIQQIQGGQQ